MVSRTISAELIKGLTGLANADGGASSRESLKTGQSAASLPSKIYRWWSTAPGNGSARFTIMCPRFHDFDIEEISVEGGRDFVVDI